MMISKEDKERLIGQSEAADRDPQWPASSWSVLEKTGALRWSIPRAYGGDGLAPVDILIRTEELAASCLTTAFILSQREAGVRQLLKGPEHLQSRFLPALAQGNMFLTVGLSQLSTSRQHLGPSLRATPLESDGFQIDGEIPWVTGADAAAVIIIGATTSDSRQILVMLETNRPGVSIEPPLPLSALTGSRTSLVRCVQVEVPPEMLLAGPAESVLGKVGGGGLETSCLAIGLSAAAIEFIQQESVKRPDLAEIASKLDANRHELRQRLHLFATSPPRDSQEVLTLRADCTTLALRSTQTSLMIAKGGGFVAPHPAQRWARQALFFLVWSCPRPVVEGVLSELTT
ncbi:acyl-CoA dehydrogenase family protein [Schlesneria sp.]|uniref:acyl-CoA dehydrogenase family protein n=1 Tax=Schlesneria sp. TaxID=2762018 RepID=UPI002EF45DA2